MRAVTSSETFAWCAKAADFTPGKAGGFGVKRPWFLLEGWWWRGGKDFSIEKQREDQQERRSFFFTHLIMIT